MTEHIVTNVHKEDGVITTLYGHHWPPRSKESVLEEIDPGNPDSPKYLVEDSRAGNGDSGNPIRLVHGDHGDYLRTDPNARRANLGSLQEPGRLEGCLKDEQGQPMPNVAITLFEPDSGGKERGWLEIQTDARGHFHLDTVPEGTRKLIATIADAAQMEETEEVAPRESERLKPRAVTTFSNIPSLFRHVERIRFKTQSGVEIRLRVSTVIEVEVAGKTKGMIGMDGSFVPMIPQVEPLILEALEEFARDPELVLKRYGSETNICAVCGRKLTNSRSVELGIGPVCRSRLFG